MSKNIHDKTFAELLSQRTFFEGFLRNYLPDEIKKTVQWETLKLYKIDGRHIQEKTQQISIADVIYLCQIDQQENMLWVHVEHQSTPDRLMPLRIINYQTGELLSYAKTHKNKNFPPIISFIYFQGESAYPYSLSLESLFEDSELGLKYFGRPVLINLPAIPDEKLREHSDIGAIEILLKHIRRRDFTHNYRVVIAGL
jgi:predicted transposase/invertase (TIGR01784 family)